MPPLICTTNKLRVVANISGTHATLELDSASPGISVPREMLFDSNGNVIVMTSRMLAKFNPAGTECVFAYAVDADEVPAFDVVHVGPDDEIYFSTAAYATTTYNVYCAGPAGNLIFSTSMRPEMSLTVYIASAGAMFVTEGELKLMSTLSVYDAAKGSKLIQSFHACDKTTGMATRVFAHAPVHHVHRSIEGYVTTSGHEYTSTPGATPYAEGPSCIVAYDADSTIRTKFRLAIGASPYVVRIGNVLFCAYQYGSYTYIRRMDVDSADYTGTVQRIECDVRGLDTDGTHLYLYGSSVSYSHFVLKFDTNAILLQAKSVTGTGLIRVRGTKMYAVSDTGSLVVFGTTAMTGTAGGVTFGTATVVVADYGLSVGTAITLYNSGSMTMNNLVAAPWKMNAIYVSVNGSTFHTPCPWMSYAGATGNTDWTIESGALFSVAYSVAPNATYSATMSSNTSDYSIATGTSMTVQYTVQDLAWIQSTANTTTSDYSVNTPTLLNQ